MNLKTSQNNSGVTRYAEDELLAILHEELWSCQFFVRHSVCRVLSFVLFYIVNVCFLAMTRPQDFLVFSLLPSAV